MEDRKWRFDFAYPADFIAFEIEGGTWTNSRHVRGHGFAMDCEKYNTATLLGWRVFRVTSDHVRDGKAVALLMAALATSQGESWETMEEAE